MSDHDDEHRPVRHVLWARLLLIMPFVAMLWVSSYNGKTDARRRSRSFTGINYCGF